MSQVEQGIVFIDLAQGTGKIFAAGRALDSLFRRFAVEVLVVGLRVGAGMVDDAVSMVRGRIECIELQWNTAGIDDVVLRPTRDDHGEARSDRRLNAIDDRLAGT